MTKEEIKFLMQNGFTVAEILLMRAQEPAPESTQEPAPESAQEPAPESAQEPAPESAQEPAPEAGEDLTTIVKGLRTEIESLRKSIQSANMQNAIVNTAGENQQSMGDILKNIAENYK